MEQEPEPSARAWRALSAGYAASLKALEQALLPLGVGPSQFQALQVLAQGPHPVTPMRLAQALVQENQSITGLLDRMERNGWVARRRDLPDRREIRVALTDVGHSVLLDATAAAQPVCDRLLAVLAPAGLRTLAGLLGSAYEAAAAAPPPPSDPPPPAERPERPA